MDNNFNFYEFCRNIRVYAKSCPKTRLFLSRCFLCFILFSDKRLKATPNNSRRPACLFLFRQLAQKILARRQPCLNLFVQPDEKSYCAIRTPELCGIALTEKVTSHSSFSNRFGSNMHFTLASALSVKETSEKISPHIFSEVSNIHFYHLRFCLTR